MEPDSSVPKGDGKTGERDQWMPKDFRPKFGQVGNFWKRYDELADRHDREMSKNLNGNLDVLLIFAALFSAINTTFISLTMPSLSPDPMDRTNSILELLVQKLDNSTVSSPNLSPAPFSPAARNVTTNCLLYASLCCSLLAAMGAMLAKEWLQSFDRSGQIGPLEQQARLRQRKFNAAQQWRLQEVILFLPNLLISSVMLFFTGIVLFIFPINKVVAGVVIAIIGLGTVFLCVTIAAGAMSPFCPYQTAISRAFRTFMQLAGRVWQRLLRWWAGQPPQPGSSGLNNLMTLVTQPLVKRLGPWRDRAFRRFQLAVDIRQEFESRLTAEEAEQVWDARAAYWMLEITSKLEDQLTVARNVFSLNQTACAVMARESATWRRLLSLTVHATRSWRDQPSPGKKQMAEIFGAALCHLLLSFPRTHDMWKEVTRVLPRVSFWSGKSSLDALSYAIHGEWDRLGGFSDDLGDDLANAEYSLRAVVLRCLIIDGTHIPLGNMAKLLMKPYDDTTLGLLAFCFIIYGAYRYRPQIPPRDIKALRCDNSVWEAFTRQNLGRNLGHALIYATHISNSLAEGWFRQEEAEFYAAFLKRIRYFAKSDAINPSLVKQWRDVVTAIISQIKSPIPGTSDPPGESLLHFIVECLRAAMALYTKSNISWDSRVYEGCWCALEHVIAGESMLTAEAEPAPNVVYGVIGWIFTREHAPVGLQAHPRVVAYLTVGLTDSGPSKKELLGLFDAKVTHFLPTIAQHSDLAEALLDAGLGKRFLAILQRRWTKDEFNMTANIIEGCLRAPRYVPRLMDDGFVDVIADMILRGDKSDLDTGLTGYESKVTHLLVCMYAHPDSHLRDNWSTDKTLLALRRIFTPAEWRSTEKMLNVVVRYRDHKELRSNAGNVGNVKSCYSILLQLAKGVKQRRPESFFISQNIDVAFNRLCAYRNQVMSWNYRLYGSSGEMDQCPRPRFVENGLL